MKEKIMIFIIGVLVGAVIATGAFYIYNSTNNSNNIQMNGGQPPEMPSGQRPEMPSGQNGQPPEMPSGQAPEMPSN